MAKKQNIMCLNAVPVAERSQKEPSERQKRVAQFEVAHAEWLDSRASLYQAPERSYGSAFDRIRNAQIRLATTPAVFLEHVMCKFELLEEMLTDSDCSGPLLDRRHYIVVAGIKGDVTRMLFPDKEFDQMGGEAV